MGNKLSAAVLFGLLQTTVSVAALEYPLYQLPGQLEVDGIGHDAVWKYIPEGRGFYKIFGGIEYARERLTSFKMGWDKQALYVYVYCQEPHPEKIKAFYSYRDGFACDESVELFLLPKSRKKYLQIVMNAKGAVYAQWSGERKAAPGSDVIKAAAKTGKDNWQLEAVIPLKVIGIAPEELNGMTFNLARNALVAPKERFLSWVRAVGKFGDQDNFAAFRLYKENGTASPEEDATRINELYDRNINWQLIRIAKKGDLYQRLKVKMDGDDLILLDRLQQKIAGQNGIMEKSRRPYLYQEWTDLAAGFTRPKCVVSMQTQAPCPLRIQVNGKNVSASKGNSYLLNFTEGANVVTIVGESKSGGELTIRFPDFSESNNAWKIAPDVPAKWQELSFDDRGWKTFTGKIPPGKFHLRQTVIWNQFFYGDLRCFNPPVREWLFSQGGIDFFYMQVYSPVKRPVSSFCVRLDLPEGFTFLDGKRPGFHRINLPWERVVKSKIRHDGRDYTRYTIYFSSKDLDNWRTAESLLPVVCSARLPVGEKGKIYYSRLIDGNVTEIPGMIPYRIIPKINGSIPKEPILSFYMGHMQKLHVQAEDLMLRDTFASGYTTFFCGYRKTGYRDKIVAKGGQVTCGFLFHPYFGPKVKESELFKLMDRNKELYATFFDGSKENGWNSKKHAQFNNQFFCPTLISSKYKKAFMRTIRDDMQKIFFKDYPNQKYTFINWEYEPWAELHNPMFKNMPAHCFCSHCKENFRRWAKIPDSVKLDNQTIYRKYYAEWRDFRYHMDGKVHEIIGDALESIGKTAIFYTGAGQKGYWLAAAKAKFLPFPGCPGNPPADSHWQKNMDDLYDFFQKNTIHRKIIGQRFIFTPSTYSWNVNRANGWLKAAVLSHDGILHPETWKMQLIRVMASLHGGLDLQNPLEMISGIRYYIGEATRLIAKYERLFTEGTRQDNLAVSKEIRYPNLLVLTHSKERLVLAFNEGARPLKVSIRNLKLPENARAYSFYEGKQYPAGQLTITIPANDVAAFHIKY